MSESTTKSGRKKGKIEKAMRLEGLPTWKKMCMDVCVKSCLAKCTEFGVKVTIHPPSEDRDTWIIEKENEIVLMDGIGKPEGFTVEHEDVFAATCEFLTRISEK